MSMYLNFTPHSWYKGAAIKKEHIIAQPGERQVAWLGYLEDGMYGYRVIELEADTLAELKQMITDQIELTNMRIAEAYRQDQAII